MEKMLCDICNHEIKRGIRTDINNKEPLSRYYRIKINGYTEEGAGCLDKYCDLCESCYFKITKFIKDNQI